METPHPDQSWRLRASCFDAPDPTIFDWMDAQELGVSNAKVQAANEVRFEVALKFCEACPVRQACEDDAIYHGNHTYTVRGGLTPYEREERTGYPVGRSPATLYEAADARLRAWQRYESNLPLEDLTASVRNWLKGEKRALAASRPPDAEWDDFQARSWNSKPWFAGQGWAISQDRTRSVVKVMYKTGAGLTARLANSRHIRYDRTTTPRTLVQWPEGMDLPDTH